MFFKLTLILNICQTKCLFWSLLLSMSRTVVLIFSLFFFLKLAAQDSIYTYAVHFTDKNSNSFSINAPSEFLSQRAIQRRKKQEIEIDISDLPVSKFYIDSISTIAGSSISYQSKWLNSLLVETNSQTTIQKIKAISFVKETILVSRVLQQKTAINKQEKIEGVAQNSAANYGKAAFQIDQINGRFLHDASFRGEGKIIAVFDGGFIGVDQVEVFKKLREDNRFKGSYNFVKNKESVFEASQHGTNVLSTMAADLDGSMIGTAPDADYWLFTTEDVQNELLIEEYYWVSAAEFADSLGADVFNTSLGYTNFDISSMNHSKADLDGKTAPITIASNLAAQKGILVVNSAGNSGTGGLNAPADGEHVFTIGAVDNSGNVASFSSRGPNALNLIKPNVSTLGAGSTVATAGGNINSSSGTSFSSPILAGMAASLWSALPNLNATEIKSIIEQSASIYPDQNNAVGYGIPNFAKAFEFGSTVPSSIIATNGNFWVYPVPFVNSISLNGFSKTEGTIFVELISINGYKLAEVEFYTSEKLWNQEFTGLSFLASGAYILRVKSNQSVEQRVVIKL
jgi:serine protease AprX